MGAVALGGGSANERRHGQDHRRTHLAVAVQHVSVSQAPAIKGPCGPFTGEYCANTRCLVQTRYLAGRVAKNLTHSDDMPRVKIPTQPTLCAARKPQGQLTSMLSRNMRPLASSLVGGKMPPPLNQLATAIGTRVLNTLYSWAENSKPLRAVTFKP